MSETIEAARAETERLIRKYRHENVASDMRAEGASDQAVAARRVEREAIAAWWP